jgi:hypothetical protein
MSKTILTDECISVGSALYGSLLKGCFPIKNFKGIYHLNHYSILYSINNGPINEFIDDHYQIPQCKSLNFGEEYFNDQSNKINITFYHKKEEIQNYVQSDSGLLISYDIICEEVLKSNRGIKSLKIMFLLDNIGEIHIKGLESEGKKINFSKNLIKVVKRGLYLSHDEIEQKVNLYKTNEDILFKKDEEFKNFSFQKNDLESKLYQIKDKIKNNSNINTIQCNGKNVMECLQEIEDKLYESHNDIIELNPLKENLDNIIKSITPDNIVNLKDELLNQIMQYQNIIIQEEEKLRMNQESRFDKNQINDASNMLENFKNTLYLTIDLNDLNNLKSEFDSEKIKYF